MREVGGAQTRDFGAVDLKRTTGAGGRKLIVTIGIARYRGWPQLGNSVNDARRTAEAFRRYGFEQAIELFDDAATAEALRNLATDGLHDLSEDDSLIVFLAGHGHTITSRFGDGDSIKTGYLIPVDGDPPGRSMARWLRLDSWLSDLARLPLRHLLVILDACHSGIALGSLNRWRGDGCTAALDRLGARRSRRVITSAQDDQRAMDSGPLPGHSLFTGCLLEALCDGLVAPGEHFTGSQLGMYLQRRVAAYSRSSQTPDFGTLEQDQRGELILQMPRVAGATRPPLHQAVEPGEHTPRSRSRSRVRCLSTIVIAALAGSTYPYWTRSPSFDLARILRAVGLPPQSPPGCPRTMVLEGPFALPGGYSPPPTLEQERLLFALESMTRAPVGRDCGIAGL